MLKTEKSARLYEKAKKFSPKGVHSGARAWTPYPLFLERANGSKVYDVDGNEYIDYQMSYGPNILGHNPPRVVEAVKKQLERCTMTGAPFPADVELTEKISKLVPCAETVRLCNSGGEAVSHAVRVARGYTKKNKIVKVEGGYHGCMELMASTQPAIAEAGPADHPATVPNSPGIPEEVLKDIVVIPYNDAAALERVVKKQGENIAALHVEPILGNVGAIMPEDGYLKALRETTEENHILLIFDEVITGFRVDLGGAQKLYGVTPDMFTFGKAIAGGFPIAGLGGKREVMEGAILKQGVMVSGTYNGNPLMVSAALANLAVLEENNGRVLKEITEKGKNLMSGIQKIIKTNNIDAIVQGPGSFFHIFFTKLKKIKNYREATTLDAAKYRKMWDALIEKGIYFPQSEWENWFLSAAHTRDDIERTLEAAETFFKTLKG
jgi:glutamate-1-semialdehyde 2,1-aminomutase